MQDASGIWKRLRWWTRFGYKRPDGHSLLSNGHNSFHVLKEQPDGVDDDHDADGVDDEMRTSSKECYWSIRLPQMSYAGNVVFAVLLILWIFRTQHSPTLTGDLHGIVPSFPSKIEEFNRELRAISNLSSSTLVADTKHYWLSLIPRGVGFLNIDSPEQHDLQKPVFIKGKAAYSTSAVHQLHCLHSIMSAHNGLLVGGDAATAARAATGHLEHCFDYLRQSILCCGDTALEGREASQGSDMPGTAGWGVQHVCKDWNSVFRWIEQHRVNNDTSI